MHQSLHTQLPDAEFEAVTLEPGQSVSFRPSAPPASTLCDGPLCRTPFTARRWIPAAQLAADVLGGQLAWLAALALTYATLGAPQRLLDHWILAGAMTFAWILLKLAGQLYPGYGVGALDRLRWLTYGGLAVAVTSAVATLLIEGGPAATTLILTTAAFTVGALGLTHLAIRRLLIKRDLWGQPVVIIGADANADALVRALLNSPKLGLVPVAVFDDEPDRADIEGVPLNGPVMRARKFARVAPFCLVACPSLSRSDFDHLARQLGFRHVLQMPEMHTLPGYCLQLTGPHRFAAMGAYRQIRPRFQCTCKRTMDLLISVPLLLLSLPVLALAAAAVRILSPGPAFFRQTRVGLGGRTIDILKLRTMYTDAEHMLEEHLRRNPHARRQWQAHCKLDPDPRIIRGIGGLLRSSSLDELPQLWNVITGEMSLVGPRPLPPYHLDRFPQPFRGLRRSVQPGITGLWQVQARANGDPQVNQSLDSFYLRAWSPWLDLYLLCQTIPAVLQRRGAV